MGILLFLALWQIAGSLTDPLFFSTPTAVVNAVPVVARRGLIPIFLNTLAIFVVSTAVSTVLGSIVGLLIARVGWVRDFFAPIILAMYSTPTILLIPLMVIWLGDGSAAIATMVFVAAFFPMIFNAQLGAREISKEITELSECLGARPHEFIREILIPSVIPYLIAGLRIAVPRAFSAVIGAEMLLSNSGTGGLILFYGDAFQTDRYLVPVALVALIAYAISVSLGVIERKLTPWRSDTRF